MTTNQKIGAAVGAVVLAAGITAAVLLGTGPTSVPVGADLQAYINAASTGDTLQLANATYTGNFTENKGLTIIGPARLVTATNEPALYYPPQTPPATLRNVEVTISGTFNGIVNTLIKYGSQGPEQDTLEEQPQGLTIESSDIHGLPDKETQRGVAVNGRNFKIVNSKVREIHGIGYDTQAICGWNGSGPVSIVGNYLEAAGENVMFGGADPSIPNVVITGVELRRNHLFKPLTWQVGHPSYAGRHWTVKNLLELKAAKSVVIDGNVFENNWVDAQTGWAILFKVQNQDGGCPRCVTEDVQFTNNTVKGSPNGLNLLAYDPYKGSEQLKRVTVINNLWLVNESWYQGTGEGKLPDGSTAPNGADGVTLEHNTHLQTTGNTMTLYGKQTNAFTYRNNLGARTGYGIKGDGTGEGTVAINTFASGAVVAGNVLAGAQASVYPSGNFYPATWAEVQLGTDYRLAPTSPFKGKATDGTDPGVNMDALLAAQGGGGNTPSTPSPSVTATPTQTPTPAPLPSPSPTSTPTATPTPQPSPTQQSCQSTSWPSSINGQNSQMQIRRAQGCYPVQRISSGMQYARP